MAGIQPLQTSGGMVFFGNQEAISGTERASIIMSWSRPGPFGKFQVISCFDFYVINPKTKKLDFPVILMKNWILQCSDRNFISVILHFSCIDNTHVHFIVGHFSISNVPSGTMFWREHWIRKMVSFFPFYCCNFPSHFKDSKILISPITSVKKTNTFFSNFRRGISSHTIQLCILHRYRRYFLIILRRDYLYYLENPEFLVSILWR